MGHIIKASISKQASIYIFFEDTKMVIFLSPQLSKGGPKHHHWNAFQYLTTLFFLSKRRQSCPLHPYCETHNNLTLLQGVAFLPV